MESMKAMDDGGPTAHFLTEAWKQMGDLKVTFPVSKKNRLVWSEVFCLTKDNIYKVMHDKKRDIPFESSNKGSGAYTIQYE